MVGEERTPNELRTWQRAMKSPKSLGGTCKQSIMFFVDDAEAHCEPQYKH